MKKFAVTYYRLEADVTDCRIFGTLQELSDWFNANIEGIYITNIEEIQSDTK